MIKTTTLAALAAAILAAGPAQGQTPPAADLWLTLEDAVRRAVEHNPDLTVVRLAQDVEAAHVGEARSAYTPMFSTTIGRSSAMAPPSNSLLGPTGVDNENRPSPVAPRSAFAAPRNAPPP